MPWARTTLVFQRLAERARGEPACGLLDQRVIRGGLGEGPQHDRGDPHVDVVHRCPAMRLSSQWLPFALAMVVAVRSLSKYPHVLVVRLVTRREQAEQQVRVPNS